MHPICYLVGFLSPDVASESFRKIRYSVHILSCGFPTARNANQVGLADQYGIVQQEPSDRVIAWSSNMVEEPRNIQREVLPNGLTILTEKMDHIRSVSMGIWVKSGSRHEDPDGQRHLAFRRAHGV